LLQPVLYALTRAYTGLMSVLPLRVARALTIALGRVALGMVPRLHKVGAENIDAAFGDTCPPAEKVRILRAAMDNLAIVAAEFAHGPKAARKRFDGYVDVRGWEHIDPERGALLISGHVGNWEWLAGALAVHCPKMSEVVRPLDYPPMNAYVDGVRRSMGIETIDKAAAATEIFSRLQGGWIVGILVDQSPRDSGVPVTFFGRDCWATAAPAMVAARARCPVHFADMTRQPDGRYVMTVHPAIAFQRTGDLLADLEANVQMTQDALEAFVRQHPGQWLWFHRRWKERARLAEEWARRKARAEAKRGRARQ